MVRNDDILIYISKKGKRKVILSNIHIYIRVFFYIGLAFRHCVNADSGLRNFIKKERGAPVRESSKLIQPVKRPTHVKRSLLHPLGARKNKFLGEHDMIWSASSDNLVPLQKKSIEISGPILISASPTDVVAATQAIVPNAHMNNDTQSNNNSSKPYEYIDIPGRPRATDAPNASTCTSPNGIIY
jgi:hypothetical protein